MTTRGQHALRRVHVLVGVGAALLLTSCSDRPNDLSDNRYYQDPPAPQPAQATSSETPVPVVAPTTRRESLELDRFALTAGDLAAEGVQLTGSARTVPANLPDCEASLGSPKAAYQTSWSYPTGSTMRQYLAEYDGNAGQVVAAVRNALTCNKVSTRAADDGQVSWCATSSKQSSCSVLEADGPVLSLVVVTAATENKAKPAVTRIAPLAATALARNS